MFSQLTEIVPPCWIINILLINISNNLDASQSANITTIKVSAMQFQETKPIERKS